MAIGIEERDALLARARAVPSDAWGAFEEVLRTFVERAETATPPALSVRDDLIDLAQAVNERRLQEAAAEFRAHAFSAAQAMAVLNVGTRQAVQRLRPRVHSWACRSPASTTTRAGSSRRAASARRSPNSSPPSARQGGSAAP